VRLAIVDIVDLKGFVDDLAERAASRIEPFVYGRVFFNDNFPRVWDMNFARVETQPPSWSELVREVDDIQGRAGLAHRRINLPDDPWVPALGDDARAQGWQFTTLIYMLRTSEGDRTNRGRAREVDYADVRPLRHEMARREPWGGDNPEDITQVLDGVRSWVGLVDGRFFAASVDGRFVAATDLYRGRGLVQIEDVNTLEEYRNQGLATDVVLEAIAAAQRDDPDVAVFLVADENDWPKALYERLGFETVGRDYTVLKLPGG
jgi:ribosomal protein S18 acetylase RimI-like enzyme